MPLTYPTSLGIAAFLVFTGTLFHWLAALGTPIAKGIWYLRATSGGNVYLGNFGWCAGDSPNDLCYRAVGYAWQPQVPGGTRLTGSLILVALTAAFGTLALIALLVAIRNLRVGAAAFFLTLLTAFIGFISWVLVLSAFVTAHRRFERDGIDATYGPAFILQIIGGLLLLLSVPFVIIGWAAARRARRDGVVHETKTTTTTSTRRRWF